MICRVSDPGPGKQRIESNDDQEVRLRTHLLTIWDGPATVEVVAGSGSGEWVGREELVRAEELVESGVFDLVLCEDLGRIARRYHSQAFCELAEDHATRVIAANGEVDTGRSSWRMAAGFNAIRHEMSNADTAERIRRSHQNIFDHGGLIHQIQYGYILPPGAKTDDELQKDPAAEPYYRGMFERLKGGARYSEVADWLHSEGVPVGPQCRLTRWTAEMVARVTQNPIVKGIRVRNRKISRRINRTGKYRAVPAPRNAADSLVSTPGVR